MRYDEHKIYISIPESCNINYADKDIISIDMDISMVVRIVSEEIYLGWRVGLFESGDGVDRCLWIFFG